MSVIHPPDDTAAAAAADDDDDDDAVRVMMIVKLWSQVQYKIQALYNFYSSRDMFLTY